MTRTFPLLSPEAKPTFVALIEKAVESRHVAEDPHNLTRGVDPEGPGAKGARHVNGGERKACGGRARRKGETEPYDKHDGREQRGATRPTQPQA